MSSYVHVFARKNDTFVELLCYCRSSELYSVLSPYAPYEKIAPLTKDILLGAKEELEKRLDTARRYNEEYKQTIAQIGSWSNTIEEKLDAINDLQQNISDRQEWIDELTAATYIFAFLLTIDAPLYFGEECGSDVTVDDIRS